MDEKGVLLRWYKASYVETVRSIFPAQDPSEAGVYR